MHLYLVSSLCINTCLLNVEKLKSGKYIENTNQFIYFLLILNNMFCK